MAKRKSAKPREKENSPRAKPRQRSGKRQRQRRPRQSPPRAARLPEDQASGSTPSATARPRASRACAICSAARAPTSPKWPISACRCRPASPSPPRSAPTSTPTSKNYPKELKAQVETALAQVGKHHRQGVRRCRQSAAGLGALRRPRLDAGHDGHRAQSRPQRRDRRGAGEEVRRPPLRLRQLPPLHHDVFRRRARRRPSPFRGDARRSTRSARATCSTPT